MADIQRIVDEVRFRLQSRDCEPNEALTRLAGDYAILCHEANARLRRCGEFLRQGLRAEALHLAESAPNLLDLFAMLDFPERAEWDEIVGRHRLAAAEPLLTDVAQELNEAYSILQPLEKLLERHRLLALTRAPLSQRLSTLRKLAEADPASPFWEDDIQEFENARHRELEQEVGAAVGRNDEQALRQLLAEAAGNSWRNAPGPALVQSIRKRLIEVVCEELAAAHAKGNLDRARELRDRWHELAAQAPGLANGRSAGATVALKWLASEDAKSRALQAQYEKIHVLEDLLASGATLEELEQARRDVLQSRRDLPEPLSGRVDSKIRELRRAAAASRRRTGLAIAAGGALALAATSFMGWMNVRHSSVQRVAQSADQFIANGQFRQAHELLKENAWMASTEEYLAAKLKLADAEKKEELRAANFQSAVDRARSAATPQAAESLVAEADRLATTHDERRIVDELKESTGRQTRMNSLGDENTFQQQLSECNDLIDRLEDLQRKESTGPAFTDLLVVAEKKARELRASSAKMKPQFAAHVDALDARLARVQKTTSNAATRDLLLEKLASEAASVNDLTGVRQYVATLKKFCEQLPSDPRTGRFSQALSNAELWQGVVHWQTLARKWNSLHPSNVKETRERIDDCKSWSTDFSGSPPAGLIRQYEFFLRSVLARDEDSSGDAQQGVRAKLLDLFSGPLVEEVEVFVTADGDRYYLNSPYIWAESKPMRYIAGVRGEQKFVSLKQAEIAEPRSHEAPQSILRKKIRELSAKAGQAKWNELFAEVGELIRNDNDLDPFLRYYFLLRTLELAGEGDLFLQDELAPTLKQLQDVQLDLGAKWMEPKDSDAQTARQASRKCLNSMKPLKETFDRAASKKVEFAELLFEKVTVAGSLARDNSSGWECRSKSAARGVANAVFWGVVRVDGGARGEWIKVGEGRSGGRISLRPEAEKQIDEGELLFLRNRKN